MNQPSLLVEIDGLFRPQREKKRNHLQDNSRAAKKSQSWEKMMKQSQ
jgi:hypothetical protein